MLRSDLKGLYNGFHRDNLGSYIQRGVLSFDRAEHVPHRSVADPAVQGTREGKVVPPGGRRLHSYANLYVNPRNIVVYRFIRDTVDAGGSEDDICVMRLSLNVLDLPDVVVTDRNAASWPQWMTPAAGIAVLDEDVIFQKYWNDKDHAMRMCAEVLVPDVVPPNFIEEVFVPSTAARATAVPLCGQVPVTVKPWWFFR
jgi:ssDNA thymidine ADP-ribosyltransferase, DarT